MKKKKILIVDDEKDMLNVLDKRLSNAGYQVIKASNGNETLKMLEREMPDLILLDIMMPGMDGFKTCKELKEDERFKSIPVLFLTGVADIAQKEEGFNLGAADYITKPINARELLARVKAHLRIKQVEEELIAIRELQTIKDMIVTLNHEMNQPLMAIRGYSEVLLKESMNNKNHKKIELLVEQVKRIDVILKKISSISKVKEKTYIGETKMINLNKSK